MIFPVVLKRDGDGFVVTFPDVPEALSSGRTRQQALAMAQDALETAIEFYFEDNRTVPLPSKPKAGQPVIELPASLSAKVLLLNEMLRQKVTAAELARRLGTTPQSVQRIIRLGHTTKIDTLAEAFKALGRRIDLRIAPGLH